MSDVRDHDELEARLRAVLRDEVATAADPPLTVDRVRAGAARRDRQDRARVGAALLAVAAIVLAVVVVRLGDAEEAYVDLGPGDPKPELHLVLDEAAGLSLQHIQDRSLDATGRIPGTVPGPEGRNERESLLFAGPNLLDPPWLEVNIVTSENPTGPWGDPASNQRATTVGGRPAALTVDPWDQGISNRLSLKWDEHRSVYATFWGMTADDAAAALDTLAAGEDGRWSLTEPPAGLTEVARFQDDRAVPDWYASESVYRGSSDDSTGHEARIATIRTAGALDEAALLGNLVPGAWANGWRVERTTVRGHPALVVLPTSTTTADGRERPTYVMYAWFEPDQGVLVSASVETADRALADRFVESLREATPDEWQSLVASCTGNQFGGTTASLPTWASGGPCPGYQQRGG